MTNYTLKKIYATKEEMLNSNEDIKDDELLYNSEEKLFYFFNKETNQLELFKPTNIAPLREENNMVIKFKNFEEFVANLGDIPNNNKVYIEDVDRVWYKNNEGIASFIGTPEQAGFSIPKN